MIQCCGSAEISARTTKLEELMRVLYYRINCGYNGVTAWMEDLGIGLKQRGVDVSYWFASGSAERAAPFERLGTTTIGSVAMLMGVLERERYDVVHIHTGDKRSLAVTLPDSYSRLVATNHGSVSHLWNSANCHALTVVSAEVAALEQPYTDLAIDVIYNAVSVDRFTRPTEIGSDAPIVAWAGRAADARTKDFARFTRIAARLASRGFRIWVADGSGASPSDFTGPECAPVTFDRWLRLTRTEMPEFYRSVASSGGVLVMTSRYEAFGLVPLEAAACGAPTIGPDVLGLREAILPEWGATYAANASDADVATLVADWIEAHPRSLSRCGERADAVAQRFSLTRMVDQYLAVYERSTPILATTKAVLPPLLPPGARECIADAPTPKQRHRSLWMPLARELVHEGEHRLALRAAWMALRHDSGVLVRARHAANLVGTVARAVRGLVRERIARVPLTTS
jgi:glycosyltransferase involved in cell wall biosynthesis